MVHALMNAAIDQMVREGLATVSKDPDGRDRIALTPKGKARAAEIRAIKDAERTAHKGAA